MSLRPGVRLALDWGEARIGVASCDPAGTLAFPVGVVAAGDGALTAIAALVADYGPVELVVGLPRSLDGRDGPAAVRIRTRAGELATRVAPIPVRLVDERFSTVTAAGRLSSAGARAKQQRGRIDAAAATVILETALETERGSGRPPGTLVEP